LKPYVFGVLRGILADSSSVLPARRRSFENFGVDERNTAENFPVVGDASGQLEFDAVRFTLRVRESLAVDQDRYCAPSP
jgi:hypothetical protein